MNIFPKEIMDFTIQFFIPKNTVRSRTIYVAILIILGLGLTSMPFIRIPIYSSARGIIKSSTERISLLSINTGKIVFLRFTNGQKVYKGDTLLVLETKGIDKQLDLNYKKIEKFTLESKDLKLLTFGRQPSFKNLKTAKYQKEFVRYNAILAEHYTKIKKLKEDFNRSKKLFSKGVIAEVEFDNIKLDYDLAENALFQFKKQSINSWQANLTDIITALEEVQNNIEQGLATKGDHVIKAPIDGWLIVNEGLQVGGFINAGKVLGEITPDDNLIAEYYISPKDIALIKRNMQVKLQVDAFNYNQWGFAFGKVTAISNDVEFINNEPTYRVRSSIENKTLYLKNGHAGTLGKGMTFNARFRLGERSAYQLLYDKVDDWLNPSNANPVTQNP